jgi:glutamate synthase (NADPH/NADH)
MPFDALPPKQGLYDPKDERDACGVGMVADLKGIPTRAVVTDALQVLLNIDHRGGCVQEGCGDGAGILCSIPDKFFRRIFENLPPLRKYAIGNVFFSSDSNHVCDAKRIFNEYAKKMPGIKVLQWRVVPTNNETLHRVTKAFEPHIEQVVVIAEGDCLEDEAKFQAQLYRLRRQVIMAINARLKEPCYVCSLSCKTITYKGMLTPPQVWDYFDDLREPDFEAHVALVHSRFSTNTFPSWQRAHPYRYLVHNGEINTIKGNTNWMRAREAVIHSPLYPNIKDMFPLFQENQTDSSKLDNIIECIHLAGRSLAEVLLLMVPQAWEKTPHMSDELRAFMKVQATVMEPWDGPAAMIMTDADTCVMGLDRNGLRPCRYYITRDQRVICSSEAGVLPEILAKDIVKKGRIQPGQLMEMNFANHKIRSNEEIKATLAAAQPYDTWIREEGLTMDDVKVHARRPARRFAWQGLEQKYNTSFGDEADKIKPGDPNDPGLRAFGYTTEALEMILLPMATKAAEALGSMGNDIPLACLSDLPRPVFDFFYQMFAQVSNPPIDPLRESIAMTLSAWIGPEQNLLAPLSREHCRRLWLEHPCLLPSEMEWIYGINGLRGWKMHILDTTYPVAEGSQGLQRHLGRVCHEACDAIRFGNCQLVILSDRAVSRDRVAMPSLLCAGAVQQALVRQKLRVCAGIIVDSGEPFEVAHHCLLHTFGADAVCPYNAYEAILRMVREGQLPGGSGQRSPREGAFLEKTLYRNYQQAVGLGIFKVMAKYGICPFQSYKGAQIANPIGLHDDITSMCFTGSPSQVGGLNFDQIAERSLRLHTRGYPKFMRPEYQISSGLDNDGKYHLRQHGETEVHMNDPMIIAKLQEAAKTNSRAAYGQFAAIHNRLAGKVTLRGQLDFRDPAEYDMTSIPIEEVEPASEIVKRFRTGAMSYGSISMEAHATLAIAMNMMGAKSNTGEGGEDPARFALMDDGNSANSAIKQLASGRFGVSIEYLSNANELQIKVAQGAKPGEGGELPGFKVGEHIAACRNSTPGVGLISPPPHHDIYSIEDLAQLIHDCKNANPGTAVSVKLVSEKGVGVVAAGVAKCKADHILVSGCEGGTGASKWTGIRSCGAPWELGLAETQHALVMNGLRGRVTLETDGMMRTGRDVVIAGLLGAEFFGFATAPLIAMGCIMMRKCHTNTCPVGIATQDPVLRAKFDALPEHAVNYLMLVAEEARTLMARLGFRTLDDLVGRAEVLTVNPERFFEMPLVLEALLTPAHRLPDATLMGPIENRCLYAQDHSNVLAEGSVVKRVVEAFEDAVQTGKPHFFETPVKNLDRTIGTTLSHKIYKAWGSSMAPATCHAKFVGTTGQSFGAFANKGMLLELEGDSNDYFGKGLSGGILVVYPQKECLASGFSAEDNIVIGNTALYGSITGIALVRGVAAERFCVRNSGAWAVVEGAGEHCCEYMTGGRVVVLGKTGSNFAAGMSGGVAWVWNPDKTFEEQVNKEMVELSRMHPEKRMPAYPHDALDLKCLLETHLKYTGSEVAKKILDRWPYCLPEFVRVFPSDFRAALEKGDKGEAATNAFKSWLPDPSGDSEKKVIEQPTKKKQLAAAFKMPIWDLEDMAKVAAVRPKIDSEKGLTTGTGFIKYNRAKIHERDAKTRSKDFIEIYEHKDEMQVRTQASRCMDCGTPFCHQSVTNQSGCPLGNLIPEWNELVKKGEWRTAFERLRETNNFPEWTGKVCPAPCEASCTLGIIDEPVAIKSVELMIIDTAWKNGWMVPRPPPSRTTYKISIIGSGPCGLAAADQLNRMGHHCTVYERDDRPGGLMMYGVPNMKADKGDAILRRTEILEKEGVEIICGAAGNIGKIGAPSADELLKTSDVVLLSTGASVGRDVTNLPGRNLKGIHLAMEYLHGSSKNLLDNDCVDAGWRHRKQVTDGPKIDVAGKNVVVLGGGDTGCDCIGTAVRQGAKSIINLVKYPKPPATRNLEKTPWPHYPDKHRVEYGHEEAKHINNGIHGVEDCRIFNVSSKEFVGDENGNLIGVRIVDNEWYHKDGRMQMKDAAGTERIIDCDYIFLAVGFVGPEGSLAQQFGVRLEGAGGKYKAEYGRQPGAFQTANPKVFAAGDCRRGQSLVVWAIKEGREAALAMNQYLMG